MTPDRPPLARARALASLGSGRRWRVRGAAFVTATALALLHGCATPKETWRDDAGAEVLVEVVPRAAELVLDGKALGAGPRSVPVLDPGHVYVFRASAPGFATRERSAEGARLAGARLDLVLRPEGFGEARRLDLDDGVGLAAAGALLERRSQHALALEYAERAVEAGPEVALGHRVLADAAQALGRRKRAIQEYSAYLQLAPDAPDRAALERRVELLRGDLTIPGADDAPSASSAGR